MPDLLAASGLSATTAVFGGVAITGLIAACWGQIKALGNRLVGLMVVEIKTESYMEYATSFYLWSRCRHTQTPFYQVTAYMTPVKPVDRVQLVAYQTLGTTVQIYWVGWRPIMASRVKSGGDDHLVIRFIRGTFNPDRLIAEMVDGYNQHVSGRGRAVNYDDPWSIDLEMAALTRRFKVVHLFGDKKNMIMGARPETGDPVVKATNEVSLANSRWRPIGWAREQLGSDDTGVPQLQRLALSTEVEDAIDEARRWRRSERWYRDHGIPWRRGWLLHGPPGTGKSSLVRAIGHELDLPVFQLDIGSMSNQSLVENWGKAIAESPSIVLIEDIDAVFDGRANRLGDSGGGMTFDCLLNILSGVGNVDGVFVVITTNHIQCVDAALATVTQGSEISSRPGRIDRVLKLAEPSVDGRRQIATRVLAEFPDQIEAVVEAGRSDTGAQFQERCSALALRLHWQQKEAA